MSRALCETALSIALAEVGVRETGGKNRGPRVEEYLRSVNLGPGAPWCAAFVYWCFGEAARELLVENPLPRTGGVLKMWKRSPEFLRVDVPRPGVLMFHDAGEGLGHVGIVATVTDSHVVTVEGNGNRAGSREGDSVVKKLRPRAYANLGWVDWGAHEVPAVGVG